MIQNLLANLPDDLTEEVFQTILNAKHFRIERIISNGQASLNDFYYDQTQHEWILLIQGAAKIEIQNQPDLITLSPGDTLHIHAHQKHRVTWTTNEQPTIWLAIHYDTDEHISITE